MQDRRSFEHPADGPDGATTFAAGRYVARRVLGEGGQKVVYLVHDASLDRECALSLLKASTLNPESIRRFQREARAMARLQGDPRVVDVHDFGDEDGAPYLVSEYVAGGDLRGEIREHAGGLPLERVIGVALDVAGALAAAHAQGIVHRDVTPGNVWLTGDGRSKLGDFGLAAGADGAVTAAGGLVGTASYMAPEQALGQACDAKSDLYSLGAVIYEMATGRQPFAGDDPLAVVSQHINTAPVAPTWHNPSIPAPLESLILALLAKAPEDRPQSGAAVCEALEALRSLSAGASIAPAALNPLERLAGGVFVGREAELGELRAAVESAIAGQRQIVLLAGEPGIGKTRLTEQLSTYAKLRRASVRWGRCVEGEGAPAFWPWIQVLRAHMEASEDAQLREDAGADAGRIAQIVPEIATRLGIETTGASSAEQARFELFEAIAAWLRRSAQRAPLVLLLDDLHWADEPSVLLLQHLAGALRDARVLIVGTYRDAEIGAAHPLTKLIGELPRLGGAKQMGLRGLNEGDVATYIELATGKPALPRLAATVFRQTEGNALFVTEVVRMLTASGAIELREESWTQEIPAGVRGVIGRRLGTLSESCRGVLTAAAVIGREFELRVLERVSDAAIDAALDAIDEAMAAQLVVLAPDASRRQGRYIFSHALVRDTLYDDLPSSKRLRMHLRAAEVLEELYGADPGSRIGALAHHFRESASIGDVSKAIEYSVRAGEAARKVYAYEECVRQWDAAIELLAAEGRSEEQAEWLQRAADVTYVSGVGFERGVEYLERALAVWERVGNERQQARTHSRLGRTFTTYPRLTDLYRAERHLVRAIELLPAEEVSVAKGFVWIGLASAQDRMLRTEPGLASARTARGIGEDLKRANLAALGQQLEGGFLAKLGHNRDGAALMDDAWEIADRIGDPVVSFYCAWTRGGREMNYRGNPRGAAEHYLRALKNPNLAEAVIQREQLSVELAYAYFRCGDLTGLRGCEVKPDERWYNEYEFEGRWEGAVPGNLRDLEMNERAGNKIVEGMRATALALEFMHIGQIDDAAEMCARGVNVVRDGDIGAELRLRALAVMAEAERGRRDAAMRHLARCDEIISWGDEWLGQIGCVELARAAGFTCGGDPAAAAGAFAESLDSLRQYELVWDEAEAYRLWGRALSSSGDGEGAMEKFQRAIDVYRRIGAGAPYIERIVREYAGSPTGDTTLII